MRASSDGVGPCATSLAYSLVMLTRRPRPSGHPKTNLDFIRREGSFRNTFPGAGRWQFEDATRDGFSRRPSSTTQRRNPRQERGITSSFAIADLNSPRWCYGSSWQRRSRPARKPGIFATATRLSNSPCTALRWDLLNQNLRISSAIHICRPDR
jgi:hypothetical protein